MNIVIITLSLIYLTGASYIDADDNNGILTLDGRIVGGVPKTIEECPYQVALRLNNRSLCGASILKENLVITACHCVFQKTGTFSVYSSATDRYTGGSEHKVDAVFQHPLYDSNTYDYDVALLRLADPIKFSETAQPIKISVEAIQGEVQAFVAGWGSLSETTSSLNTLYAVFINTLPDSDCVKRYVNYGYTSRMICAGVLEGGKDTCFGDSGSGLINTANGQLIALVSWGFGCARPDYPGVYTNIADSGINSFIKSYM